MFFFASVGDVDPISFHFFYQPMVSGAFSVLLIVQKRSAIES
jgi:hypothetical protein